MNGPDMKTPIKPQNSTNGLPIPLEHDTDLGLAMLIVETEGGRYQPVAVVSTITEAKEIAHTDFAARMREREKGGEPECPAPIACGCGHRWRVPQGKGIDFLPPFKRGRTKR